MNVTPAMISSMLTATDSNRTETDDAVYTAVKTGNFTFVEGSPKQIEFMAGTKQNGCNHPCLKKNGTTFLG